MMLRAQRYAHGENGGLFIFAYGENLRAHQGVHTGSCLGFPVHTSQNVPSTLSKGASGNILSAVIFGSGLSGPAVR